MSNTLQLSLKKFLATSIISTAILAGPLGMITVNAQTNSINPQTVQIEQSVMLKLKTQGDTEINKRLVSLKDTSTKITNAKKLTSAQKSTFTNNINTEINNLTTLQSKIDNDSDLTTLKNDVKSVVVSFRVYALYLPQTRIIVSSDDILYVNSELTTIANKLNVLIQKYQVQGKDVSSLTTAYNDMLAKVSDSTVQANKALNTVTPLNPAGYPGNITQLTQAKADVKTGVSDLKAARADIKTIVTGLKELKATTIPSSFPTN